MKLYVSSEAPSPLRVLLYIAEKNAEQPVIALAEVPVDLRKGEQRQSEHLARNPWGKLPVLETGDGSIIAESLAIIEYLRISKGCWPTAGASWAAGGPRRAGRLSDADRLERPL